MAADPTVPRLTAGAFFGASCRSVSTPSFQFSELTAIVPEKQVPRHTHETPHFILITEGAYLTEARNQNGICLPGTFIFNPAGTTHRDCFRSATGKFLSVSVGPNASHFLGRAIPFSSILSGNGIRMLGDRQIEHRIMRELRLSSSPVLLEEFGLELIGLLSGAEDATASRAVPQWLLLAQQMVEDCAGEDLRIEELASASGVHPVYLARAYRRHFGYSPGEHVRRCRLRRVQELLTRTVLPLTEVALQCGFCDQSQMTRLFTRSFGIPPARYRRLFRR